MEELLKDPEVVAQLFDTEDLKGIDAEMVNELFPEQVRSGKAFVVAMTEISDWADGSKGFRILIAQSLTGIGGSNVTLATSILNGWDAGQLTFCYVNGVEGKGAIEHTEANLGKYVFDILKAKLPNVAGCKLLVTDTTKTVTYVNKAGETVEVKPRQSRKGELYVSEDGEPITRQVTLDVWLTPAKPAKPQAHEMPKQHFIIEAFKVGSEPQTTADALEGLAGAGTSEAID